MTAITNKFALFAGKEPALIKKSEAEPQTNTIRFGRGRSLCHFIFSGFA